MKERLKLSFIALYARLYVLYSQKGPGQLRAKFPNLSSNSLFLRL